MSSQPDTNIKKLNIFKGLRLPSYICCTFVGVLLLVGFTFAWYTLQKREAETKAPNVMKPYYLNLSNPSETSALQLSVGSILHGSTKQIVFCVNTEEAEQINKDTTTFAYDLELVHTDNLPLNYKIYELSKLENAEDAESNIIIAEDILIEGAENTTVETTYWEKKTSQDGTVSALKGTDVSAVRHAQVGLIASADQESTAGAIINKGTYISYGKTETIDNGLELTVGGIDGAYTSQYFVLEISWKELNGNDDYSNYDKETDMIYLLAKILQPEPEAISQ